MLRKLHDFGVNQTLRLALFELHVIVADICLHSDVPIRLVDIYPLHPDLNSAMQNLSSILRGFARTKHEASYLMFISRIMLLPHHWLRWHVSVSSFNKYFSGHCLDYTQ